MKKKKKEEKGQKKKKKGNLTLPQALSSVESLTHLSAPVKQPLPAVTDVFVHKRESVLMTPSVEQD